MPTQQVSAPASLKSCATDIALYTFSIGRLTYTNKSAAEAQTILRSHINRLRADIEGRLTQHRELIALRAEAPLTVGTSDFLAGAQMPPIEMWNVVVEQVRILGQISTAPGQVQATLVILAYALREYDKCYKLITEYADKNSRGFDVAIDALTFVKSGAEIAVGAYNPYVGAGYAGLLKFITQASELRYGMRDRIDWENIVAELIIDELFALAASKASDKIIQSLNLPHVQMAFPFSVKDRLQNLLRMAPNKIKELMVKALVDKAGATLGDVLKAVLLRQRGSGAELTWESVSTAVSEQFTSTSLSKDVVSKIVGEAVDSMKKP